MNSSTRNSVKPAVVIVAMNQEPCADLFLREQFTRGLARAKRQADRYPDFDLAKQQATVGRNLLHVQFQMDGHYMGLLDLINYIRNGNQPVTITAENADRFLTLGRTMTVNGVFLLNYLARYGFPARLIQNYVLEKAGLDAALADNPLAVAISSTFASMDEIKSMAGHIKAVNPGVKVVVGGSLVKKVMDKGAGLKPQTLDYLGKFWPDVDVFIVESQGERTLVKVIDALKHDRDLAEVPNLALFDHRGQITFTPREAEPIDMDQGVILWDQLPLAHLPASLPVNTSRGCMYNCRFCTYRQLIPGVNYKSLEALGEELKSIKRLGFVRHVRFTDDNFTANRARLFDVCRLIKELDAGFTWSTFARVDALTPETAGAMAEAGCEFLELGIESASNDILKYMHKHITVEQTYQALSLLNQVGIMASGAFIVGFPGETKETLRQTCELINSSGLTFYRLNFFTYTSGMLLHQERQEFDITGLGMAWRHKTMDAATASACYPELYQSITNSLTDGFSSTWETFKLLRGEGFSKAQIIKMFGLMNALNRTRLTDGEDSGRFRNHRDEVIASFQEFVGPGRE
ncbi:MAG: radical SAM protein [Deltaproteobacteria bacterium]|nr:radical SAM protein [Deltaproteobacteria bacterium]